ncbi:hypothetical protein Bca52824_027831 [Brassica carinata]|uniref:Uncharacterized protein n=1 Tax=Brassica carinata TaxID=52824 RepID=A0A8X7VB87_BRACI|nr:hypothetical protein Bca52824_027831 [Brassica carinata]
MAQSASSSTIEYKNEKGILCNCNGLARIEQAWTELDAGSILVKVTSERKLVIFFVGTTLRSRMDGNIRLCSRQGKS